eukprot:4790343-Karenia_brevis.AAC.1
MHIDDCTWDTIIQRKALRKMKSAIARFLKKHAHEADVQLSQYVIAARAALKTPLHDLSRIVSKASWK